MPRERAAQLLPELDEAEDLLGLLALAQVSVGIAEGAPVGILGEESEDARLAARAHRDVMPLDHRVLAIVRDRVEIEVERVTGKEVRATELLVVGGKESEGLRMGDARGILREEALLREGVQPRKQGQSLVGDECHHVALALDRPQLQRKRCPQGMGRRNHLRARQAGA